ncbi:hypothetical protein D9M71_160810 [compost metagenome]
MVVALGHQVGVLVVVQGVGDVGFVRVALFEGDGHFGAGDQRQVQAVGVAGVGAGLAQPFAFAAGGPGVAVEEELDPVASLHVDFGVQGVALGVGDACRQGAGDLWLGRYFWAKAQAQGVGHGFEIAGQAAVAGGARGDLRDHHAGGEGLGGAAADAQDLTRGQGGAAAGAAEAGLVVEVAFVAQARIEKAAFALQVFVAQVGLAEHAVGFGVVVGVAVGVVGEAAGCGHTVGGGLAAGLVDLAVEEGTAVVGVIGAYADLLFHHPVAGFQGPDAVLLAVAEARRRAQRQLDVELVAALVVAELDDVEGELFVLDAAVPDADVGQDPADEGQVAFLVLHDLLARRVLALEVEAKVPGVQTVAVAQNAFDDVWHGLVLIDPRLLAAIEQGQARLQGDFVAGFVD